jgi:hypothetical protein
MNPVETRVARRAYVEKVGWGLTQEVWDRVDQAIDCIDNWENEDRRAIAEMIVVGLEIGANADTVARVTGLNRDKFVRPKAKLLRENKCWVKGKTAFSPETMGADDTAARNTTTEIVLFVLAAEGRITRSQHRWYPPKVPT